MQSRSAGCILPGHEVKDQHAFGLMVWQTRRSHHHSYSQSDDDIDVTDIGPDIATPTTGERMDEPGYTGLLLIRRAYVEGDEDKEANAIPDLVGASEPYMKKLENFL